MEKANKQIREACYYKRVPLWRVAKRLGKSYSWIVQKLRVELPEDERGKMLAVIEELAREEHENG